MSFFLSFFFSFFFAIFFFTLRIMGGVPSVSFSFSFSLFLYAYGISLSLPAVTHIYSTSWLTLHASFSNFYSCS